MFPCHLADPACVGYTDPKATVEQIASARPEVVAVIGSTCPTPHPLLASRLRTNTEPTLASRGSAGETGQLRQRRLCATKQPLSHEVLKVIS